MYLLSEYERRQRRRHERLTDYGHKDQVLAIEPVRQHAGNRAEHDDAQSRRAGNGADPECGIRNHQSEPAVRREMEHYAHLADDRTRPEQAESGIAEDQKH